MSFLRRLADRALGVAHGVQPRMASRFAQADSADDLESSLIPESTLGEVGEQRQVRPQGQTSVHAPAIPEEGFVPARSSPRKVRPGGRHQARSETMEASVKAKGRPQQVAESDPAHLQLGSPASDPPKALLALRTVHSVDAVAPSRSEGSSGHPPPIRHRLRVVSEQDLSTRRLMPLAVTSTPPISSATPVPDRLPSAQPRPEPPTVRVSIGRIDVRAHWPQVAAPIKSNPQAPQLSLQDYLGRFKDKP